MKKGEMLNAMLVLATNKHAGQMDKGGHPYILHPLAVMTMLNSEDEELMCGAIGHDLIEDTDTTYHELKEAGMTERVVNCIRCLTKLPGETYDEYKAKVKSNADAVRVKLCDLRHNTDIRRLRGVAEKDISRMARYFHFYMELQAIIKEPCK